MADRDINEPSDSPDPTATILHINNLPKRVTEQMMLDIMKKGLPEGCENEVVSAKIMASTDPACIANDTCCCFVQFSSNKFAKIGLHFINGRDFFNKKVKVSWAVSTGPGSTPKIIGASISIYVGDLDDEIDEIALKKCFDACGDVLNAKIVREPTTNANKGFGFVTFSNKQDAENAIQTMNGILLGKRRIKTNWASRNNSNTPVANTLNYDDVLKASTADNVTVYVGNIPSNANPAMVKQCFSQYGTVLDTRIFIDKGYAFIKFSNHEDAAHAITKAHGEQMCGSFLKCWWGKDSENQGGGGQGGSRGMMGSSNQQQPVFSQPQFSPMTQGVSVEEMQKNLMPMFQANNMTPAQQQQMLEYIKVHPEYYNECMTKWTIYTQQCQQAAMMMSQQYAMYYQQQSMQQPNMQQQQQMQQPHMMQQQQPQMQQHMQQPGGGYPQQQGFQNPHQ